MGQSESQPEVSFTTQLSPWRDVLVVVSVTLAAVGDASGG
jgi:hypothetical protein